MSNREYVSKSGLRIKTVNGEAFVDSDELISLIAEEISKLPAETRPNVLAAQDARKIIRELMQGIGGEMEKFNADSKKYLAEMLARSTCSAAELRRRLAESWPKQWWREKGYGLQPNGKFKCPGCGKDIEILPYRKGVGRVRSHNISGRSRCIFANHMEPQNAKVSDGSRQRRR